MSFGVALNELHCPTCGTQFDDFKLYVENDNEVFDVDRPITDIIAKPAAWRRYIACPRGHKWTVKMIWRCPCHPDLVQLGEYLGEI